jgi:DNA-binding transcriptional LysR family regulator
MEFQQLEMFAAVVEEGSVRGAAERVFRTAPAVSIALRKLEEELGAPLFDRSERHHHQLTASGRLLYSYATRILEMRKVATAAVKDLGRGQHANLRIGTLESTSLYLLPSLIHAFNEAHPGAKTEVICGNSERLLKALGNRTIELALVANAPDEPELDRHLIVRDELVLITSPSHRLASLQQVHVSDLSGEFLIVQGIKSVLRERIVQAFQESDIPFNVSVENIAIEAIKRMVAEELGIGFVPLMCVREEAARGKLTTIKVEGISSDWNLWLVHRKDHSLSATTRAFIDASLAHAQSSEDPRSSGLEEPENQSRVRTDNQQPIAIHPRRVIHC